MPDDELPQSLRDLMRDSRGDLMKQRLASIKRWPRRQRASLKRMLTDDRRGRLTNLPDRDRLELTRLAFEPLDDASRRRLWDALLPNLGPHVERAWRDTANRPFQSGFFRSPFRAPHREAHVAARRIAFTRDLIDSLRTISPPPDRLAGYIAHIRDVPYRDRDILAFVLGCTLRNGGPDADALRDTLDEILSGEHRSAALDRQHIAALLNSDQPDDWACVERLLLAAKRQEGLRQTILEAVDCAHTGAFRSMLGVILEQDLVRFSATVRAFDCWLGFQWAAAGSEKLVHETIARLCQLLDDEGERTRAIDTGDANDAYLALWAEAFYDAEAAIPHARRLLTDDDPERRFVALTILDRIRLLPETLEAVADRIVSEEEQDTRLQMGLVQFLYCRCNTSVADELFNACARIYHALPERRRNLGSIVWPWVSVTRDRRFVADALQQISKESPERMIPFAESLSPHTCRSVVEALAGLGREYDHRKREWVPCTRRRLTPEGRSLTLRLLGHRTAEVQAVAFRAIDNLPVEEDEIERLVSLLHRKSPAIRSGAVRRLASLSDERALEVARRLMDDKHSKKRSAGLEIAAALFDDDRAIKAVRESVRERRDALDEPETREVVRRILGPADDDPTLDDCLGLVPPGSRAEAIKPKFDGVTIETRAAKASMIDLASLLIEHADTAVALPRTAYEPGESTVVPLGVAGWRLPEPKPDRDPHEDAAERLPLADVWLDWLEGRAAIARDADGLELWRAFAWFVRSRGLLDWLPGEVKRRDLSNLPTVFATLLRWCARLTDTPAVGPCFVQYFEDALARDAMSPQEAREARNRQGVREPGFIGKRAGIVSAILNLLPADQHAPERARFAALLLIARQQTREDLRGPSIDDAALACDAGLINDRDLLWWLLHPRPLKPDEKEWDRWTQYRSLGPIGDVTGLRPHPALAERPALQRAITEMRDRIVEVELTRGEAPGPASVPAARLRSAGAADAFFRLAAALGGDKLVRQRERGVTTRSHSLCNLIHRTAPAPDDTPEDFARRFADAEVSRARLLDLAMYCPQWAAHIEHALEFPGLEEVVWWIHAHTKEHRYWDEQAMRDLWAARINERTELDADDLEEGAVDVAWFHRVIDLIGEDGWDRIEKPARYASGAGGHKRAMLFAGAMLGRVPADRLRADIDTKRKQDALRAYGLVPLPSKPAEAKTETLARFQRIHEFKRESRQFGSMRQNSEGKAVRIALDNLARTAGYLDPRRLQWAMETEAVADLAKGPVSVTEGETTVTLAITDEGDPALTVEKKGRRLKAVPSRLRKHPEIKPVRSRVTDLRRQRSRMRDSLEEAMCRGDEFSRDELAEFCRHPMLRPIIERLVFIGESDLIGCPEAGGKALRDHAGDIEPVGKRDALRIAHPIDLLHRRDWSDWQRDCFAAERVQPFKQVFRETYPKTDAERDGRDMTRRYAGHQVNPRQALALLKQRQWIFTPEEGVRRVHHDEKIIAELWFQEHFYTPAEVESPTVEGITFHRRGRGFERMPIDEVPDRLFSEAMRDIDLVVSVAHAGGVDPETTASTVEMRAALLRETCTLLGLDNVRVDDRHAFIDGERARYSVHLGSAVAHVMPGRALLIVAVHGQRRGRLFLPFADDDPKTAEVLSKTLLLARDKEIKDPSILRQISA